MKKFLSSVFLLTGISLLIFGFYLVHLRYSPKTLAFATTTSAASISHSSLPKILKIESAGIALPVFPADIKNNSWEVTPDGVSYLKTSSKPGEKGNSVFYGHNWSSILGNLVKVKPGDSIEVVMDSGKEIKFIVEYTAIVEPTQTSVIEDIGDTRITIYTCTGFLDTKRFVVVAKPIK